MNLKRAVVQIADHSPPIADLPVAQRDGPGHHHFLDQIVPIAPEIIGIPPAQKAVDETGKARQGKRIAFKQRLQGCTPICLPPFGPFGH